MNLFRLLGAVNFATQPSLQRFFSSREDFLLLSKSASPRTRMTASVLTGLLMCAYGLSLHNGTKVFAAGQAAEGKTLPLIQAHQADSFVDSIGVGTHLTYTDTLYYSAWPQVFSALQTLGIRHIRDGYYDWAPNAPFIAEHQQLAQAGIKTDYVVPFNSSTTAQGIEQIFRR
jgi:hypothetical protein